MNRIPGVGPDEPIVDMGNGYMSTDVPYAMHIMPGAAILHVANIMYEGAKTHGANNWLRGSVDNHVNKALVHLMAFIDKDEQDDHLGHATWRMLAALQIYLKTGKLPPTEGGVCIK